jgi:hypothetical protein
MLRLNPSSQHNNLVARLVEALQTLHVQLHDPAEPDAALAVPGGPPKLMRHLLKLAEAEWQLSTLAARDSDEGERPGAMLKSGQRRSDHRKYYCVVVEMPTLSESGS